MGFGADRDNPRTAFHRSQRPGEANNLAGGRSMTPHPIPERGTDSGTRSAVISDCGRYRYRLERHGLSGAGAVAWIMVNPSTADATTDDATIRKVVGFSERMGAGWLIVGNKFAYRATDIGDH